ncbi:MAG: glycosyltransferase family 4 protein [Pirellulaceae bacterium]|nr:glycosyltransferase family 4 protein [Pirellulaceae bacterium]
MFQRIFIDATYTLASGKNSGIERVVRSLLRESEQLAGTGVIPQPQSIVSIDGKFYAPNAQQLALFSKPAAMHANVLASMPWIYRAAARVVCAAIPSRKLRKWALPQAGHLGLFKLPHNWYEERVRRQIVRQCTPLDFRSGDLVLLPDAYWVNRLRSSVWTAAGQVRAQGGMIATLLYDLIPLTHPEFVGPRRHAAFLDYLKKTVEHSDLLLAISDTVRDQVASFLPTITESDTPACRDVRSIQLGAELESVQGPVREEVRALFAQEQVPYLMVATFDPRKNHRYLLDAFELLWESQPDLKLCLVGRIGSRCDEIVQRITQHPRLGKNLFLFSDLSDAELHHCYNGARGVIFPSIVEGFGLPIVESLWFGKRTFVSDTPIHREVGRDDCCYFSLEHPTSLVSELLAWEEQYAAGSTPPRRERPLTTWSQCTCQVFEHCEQAAAERAIQQPTPALRRAA